METGNRVRRRNRIGAVAPSALLLLLLSGCVTGIGAPRPGPTALPVSPVGGMVVDA